MNPYDKYAKLREKATDKLGEAKDAAKAPATEPEPETPTETAPKAAGAKK